MWHLLSQRGKVSPWANLAVLSGVATTLSPFLFLLPMTLCGYLALRQIRQSGGKLGGRRRVIGAFVLGYGLALIIILMLLSDTIRNTLTW